MRILHITPAYYPATYWGGPIFTVYHMNNALAKIPGVELKVLTTDSSGPKVADRLTDEEKQTFFPYEVIFTRRIAGASISMGLMRNMLPLIRWADVVHLTATFSFSTIPALALCRIVGKPVVWSLRGALLDDQNRNEYNPQGHLKHVVKALWNGTCRQLISPERVVLHVTTVQERDAVAKVFSRSLFAVVPNGVEAPKKMPVREAWLSDGSLRLMFLGRLAPKKGIENLLRAVAKLNIPVSLDLYGVATVGQGGENYGEGLVRLAKELGVLNEKVHFRGQVNGEAKTRAFMEAHVCVIPSYSESFCIVVAEALAHGTPVIVSDRLAWAEVASRGCGLVVGNDPDSLAKAIEAIKEIDLVNMGKEGWRWMRDEFGWDVVAGKMNDIYRRMLRSEGDAA